MTRSDTGKCLALCTNQGGLAHMSRRTLEKIELSSDYFVTVEPTSDSDRLFTFSGCGPTQQISLHAEEIEILIPFLQRAQADMLRQESGKVEPFDMSEWMAEPEMN
jgi:hypothetical protein